MTRPENEIFEDIQRLCALPGYAHVIAYYCYKDNTIGYDEELKPEDLQNLYSWERLIRTEISTLIGLMVKAEIQYEIPEPKKFQSLIITTDQLMKELHAALNHAYILAMSQTENCGIPKTPFASGEALREAIFYGAESAYKFQYRDFAIEKYSADNLWLKKEKGFTIAEAAKVAGAISKIQNEKVTIHLKSMDRNVSETMTILPGYLFTVDEIVQTSGVKREAIENVVEAFSLPRAPANLDFNALNDYNETKATPIIKYSEKEYLLFESYGLFEALYDSPFYWMISDKSYKDVALKNRGNFTENYSAKLLKKVFKDRVHRNVNIIDKSGNDYGEIDVLVVFANRALVIQAKSKKLTLESRKGNDQQIKDDFKKGVQNAYDQGYSCASALNNKDFKYILQDGTELELADRFKEIYILCVLSDHYPALSWQARHFLKHNSTAEIFEPFVLDIFTLDVLSEILSSPLYFLSYVNRHAMYLDRVLSSHEIAILAYHLKSNLWIDEDKTMLYLADDLTADIDIAMIARRENLPGNSTPPGILTKFIGTPVGDLLQAIENKPEPVTIDLGFTLLMLSGKTIEVINNYSRNASKIFRLDGKHHDCSVSFDGLSAGLTFHYNTLAEFDARPMLNDHCIKRKYAEKAGKWFGVCINPESGEIRFGLELDYQWQADRKLDALTSGMKKGKGRFGKIRALLSRPKVGRNELCPCGSGKKYKRCCST